MLFKDVVKKLIKDQGMTQVEFAEKIGLPNQGALSSMFSRKNITADTLLKVLNALGYTLAIVKKDDVNLTFLEMAEKKEG